MIFDISYGLSSTKLKKGRKMGIYSSPCSILKLLYYFLYKVNFIAIKNSALINKKIVI